MKQKMQQYQTKQEEDERTHKAELADKAARHLESFYQVQQLWCHSQTEVALSRHEAGTVARHSSRPACHAAAVFHRCWPAGTMVWLST